MNHLIRRSLLIGTMVTLLTSALLALLISMDLLGPTSEIADLSYQLGGTILFAGIYLFLLIGVFAGMQQARKRGGDTLTFKSAFMNGALISFFVAVTGVIATIVLYELIFPTYATMMGEKVRVAMRVQSIDESIINEKVTTTIQYYGTMTQAKYAMLGNLTTGLFYSLVLAIFMKK